MALTYAIPDLHGRLDLLEGALDLITRHSRGQRSTIVTLGDYVDRGPSAGHRAVDGAEIFYAGPGVPQG